MEKPYLDQEKRMIILNYPKSGVAAVYLLDLHKKILYREISIELIRIKKKLRINIFKLL